MTERICYSVVIVMLLLLVWAFGVRLEEHKKEFEIVQTRLTKVEQLLKNDTDAERLLRSLRKQGIDIQETAKQFNKK